MDNGSTTKNNEEDVDFIPLPIARLVWFLCKTHSPFSRAVILYGEPIPWVDLVRILPETESYFSRHSKVLYPNDMPGWLSDSFIECYNKAIVEKGNEVNKVEGRRYGYLPFGTIGLRLSAVA